MTHVTCRLTAKNRDQLRNPALCNRVWATFFIAVEHGRKDGCASGTHRRNDTSSSECRQDACEVERTLRTRCRRENADDVNTATGCCFYGVTTITRVETFFCHNFVNCKATLILGIKNLRNNIQYKPK